MAIYRGPGGPGDATGDAANATQLAQEYATNAEDSATAAAASASSASSSATAASASASAASTSATNASNSATAAETSAGNAENFATAAEVSAGNAEAFATAAEISAGNAETSATGAETYYLNTVAIFGNAEAVAAAVLAAETSAGNSEAFSIVAFNHAGNAEDFAIEASGYATTALSHAGNAESSATAAAGSASAAATSASNAASSYDSFDDRYLGAKSSAPSTDNDGDALITGALYWNSTSDSLFIWDGAAWNAAAIDVSGAVTSFNTRGGAVTLTATDVSDALAASTAAVVVPVGTEAQRPTPAKGMFRFNDDTDTFEGYDGTEWGAIGGGVAYERKTANYTIAAGEGIIADTSGGAWTLTLPLSPASGDYVFIVDGAAWGTNNLTVGRNGSTIESASEDLTLDISGAAVQMVYDGTTWQVYAQIGGAGGTVVTEDGTQTLTNKTLGATTLSGTLSVADNIVQRPVLKDYAIEGSAIGNVGATRTFDLETANFFSATLDQNSTFTFSNPPASGDFGGFIMELTNGGAYTITWDASVDWVGGTAPTLTAAGVDQLVFTTRDGGTTWYGFVCGLDIKSP